MDRWRAMQAFVAVVDAHSYSAAARRLRLSRSHLSKQISALEADLGLRLLNRSTRHVSPTELGNEYYRSCRRLLSEIEDVEFNLKTSHGKPRGKIKLLAPKSLAVLELAGAISGFTRLHPEVEVTVILEDAFLDLVKHGFDLALRFGAQSDSSLIAKKVCSFEFQCCATLAYLKKHGVPKQPADLGSHQCLRHATMAADSRWVFTRMRKEFAVEVEGTIASNSTVFLRECVLKGEGIGLMPSYSVRRDIKKGTLRPVLAGYKAPTLSLFLVYPARQHLATKVRLCIDFLSDWFRRRSS
jgi:DNA-binding transcriptional LysR family regulator